MKKISLVVSIAAVIAGCSANGNGSGSTLRAPNALPLPEVTLSVQPEHVQANQPATISWTSSNTTSCVASGSWTGAQALSNTGVTTGAMSTGTYSFGLTCSGEGGSSSAVRTLTVGQPPAPEVALQMEPAVVQPGGTTTLKWSAVNAANCVASGGTGGDGWSGNQATSEPKGLRVGPLQTAGSFPFVLECNGPGGTSSDTRILSVSSSAPPPPPAVTFSAGSNAIQSGQSTTVSWSSTGADSCSASGGTGSDGWSGSKALSSSNTSIGPISGAGSYTYTLTCTGPGGSTSSNANVVVSSSAPAGGTSVEVSVSPTAITAGTAAALSWNTTGVTSCEASGSWGGSQPVAAAGYSTGTITAAGTYSYTLSCTGSGGSVTDTATLTVNPAPASVLTFAASPPSVDVGQSTSLAWTSVDAASCTGSGGTGSDSWSGARDTSSSGFSVGPFASAGVYTYSLACAGPGGLGAIQSTTVTVTAPPPQATVVGFSASPNGVTVGGSTTLSWSTSGATSCTATGGTGTDGWNGSVATSNAGLSVGPLSSAGTYVYTLACTGPGGPSAPANVTVSVGAATPPAAIVSLNAAPTSIVAGGSTTLSWSTTNATSCTAANGAPNSGWSGALPASSAGTTVGPISAAGTYTYSLVCTGSGGDSGLSSVIVNVDPLTPPATVTGLSLTPSSIQAGQSTSIAWSSANASSCTASGGAGGDGWGGSVATSSAGLTVGPIQAAGTYTYSLACTGSGGTGSTSSVSLVVSPAPVGAPTISLQANGTNPAQIQPGDALTLKWTTTDATACTASGGTGSDGWAGSRPTSSTGLGLGAIATPGIYTYSMSCSGPGGSSSSSVVVTVIATSAADCDIGVPSTALRAPAASVSSSVNGICLLGCGVSNSSRVIDSNPVNFASMNVAVGVAAYDTLRVTDGSTSYPAGRKAGFVIAKPGYLLSLSLLSNLTVRTFLNGTQQEAATAATILGLSALGGSSIPDAGFLGFTTSKPFNAVRIDVGSLLSVADTVNVYGACVTLQ